MTPKLDSELALLEFKLANDGFGGPIERVKYAAIEAVLRALVEWTGLGELDGDCVGEGFFQIYLYGPSAKAIWKRISLLVRLTWPRRGSSVQLRNAEGDVERFELP